MCFREIIKNNEGRKKVRTYKKTKQLARTSEMSTLTSITGHILRRRVPNQEIRRQCEIHDITKFI